MDWTLLGMLQVFSLAAILAEAFLKPDFGDWIQ